MIRRAFIASAIALALPLPASAGGAHDFSFPSIDGGEINLADFAGRPVLVVNTASRCGFTPQYDALQELHDTWGPKGLVVLAVPSGDFNQELASDAAVKEFCEVNFSLTLPMTTIQHVRGAQAHPFYAWAAQQGMAPGWNFSKILIDGQGQPVQQFGSPTKPTSKAILSAVEPLLPRG